MRIFLFLPLYLSNFHHCVGLVSSVVFVLFLPSYVSCFYQCVCPVATTVFVVFPLFNNLSRENGTYKRVLPPLIFGSTEEVRIIYQMAALEALYHPY